MISPLVGSVCCASSSSGTTSPSCTFCWNVLWYVRNDHLGSDMLPKNSRKLFPDGSSSLIVNGWMGLSEVPSPFSFSFSSSSGGSPSIALILLSSSSILLYVVSSWTLRRGWSWLRSAMISRRSPSTVVSCPRSVGGRVRSSSGMTTSQLLERTSWRLRSSRSRILPVYRTPSAV